MNYKSFLNISDLNTKQLIDIISPEKKINKKIIGKMIGFIFEKPSTRTRLSFAVGLSQLGANHIDIKLSELNLSRQESFEDTFKALGCYLDGIIYRTQNHQNLIEASKFSSVPVINALSDESHPCQIISDLYTLKENFGSLSLTILWIGDPNNVCFSLVEAANLIDDLNLIICSPKKLLKKLKWRFHSKIKILDKIDDFYLKNVDCVMTDVFISMNDKDDISKIKLLKNYCVTSEMMSKTKSNSVFMHCLPAKVGYEVTKEVFNSSKSIVWRQAYNRMVAQKKLLQLIYQ